MKPKVIAHRGASVEAPENSLAAFQRAIDAGADMIELDVRLTRDGAVVVLHDGSLERTTTGRGAVHELTLEQVRQAHVLAPGGGVYEPRESPPLLLEALELARGKVGVNVEIKGVPERSDELVAGVLAAIDASGVAPEELIISSFDHGLLARIAALRHDLALAPLFSRPVEQWESLPGAGLHPHHALVDEAFMTAARRAGRFVNVWTVNEPARQLELVRLGVDGIITDDPRSLRRLLAGGGGEGGGGGS